ncbi:E3 ubiquitin-protein ligase ring1-like [Phtheirospermum japonicum]|uniref:RING-type E3 ubiquitin transferase n=1 Tax=Phtheirospermum japonicum TaxID=374723 RepID=A0A830C1L8_9LAMI|nr:E3 ubiquitin-protein ligase ring1-like [Phtheirospermum japonicum]
MDCGAHCSICLEEIVRGGEGLFMPCCHVFHEDCIKKWLRTSHYCPVCRFEMPKRLGLNFE